MLKTQILASESIGDLYFGQLHPYHQDFFGEKFGQHTRIRLRDLPHYTLWRDGEYENPETSDYYRYLEGSWRFYCPDNNTHERRLEKIDNFIALREDIEKNGVIEPVRLVVARDGAKIIIDGNHRASLAYHLGIDIPCRYLRLKSVIKQIVHNKDEFYGTMQQDRPYQSIFDGGKEIIKGRRRDIFKRFKKMDIPNDIRGKTIADVGSNIAMNAMLAWYFGARESTAFEFSEKIASSALRLSTILNNRINVHVHDLGNPILVPKSFDTVFCFSLYAHVGDKEVLERNIERITKNTLYFEGHENTEQSEYAHIFQHFRKTELLGYNDDGIHSSKATRPFFRCLK